MSFETGISLFIGALIGFTICIFAMGNRVSYEKIQSGREFQMYQDLWQCTKTKELPYTYQ